MDKKLLFTASLLALFGGQAMADKVALPTVAESDCYAPTTVLNGSGTEFYLYNVQGRQFVIAGNDWGTRASFSLSSAAPFKSETTTNTTVSSFYLTNKGTGSWKKMFVDDTQGKTWMDYATQTDRNVEYVANVSGNTFELYSYGAFNTAVDGSVCVAWQKGLTGSAGQDAVNGLLKPADFTSTDDYGTKWMCVNTSFDLALYAARTELATAINEGDDLGLDVSEATAVYNNGSATAADVNAALAKIAQPLAELKRNKAINESGANAENPFSLADYIAPSTALDGWTVVGKAYDVQTKSYTVQETGDALTKGLNCWTSSSNGGHLPDGSISQTLENLPNGVYEVSVDINASCGGANKENTQEGTTLFANDKGSNCSSLPDKPVHVSVKAVVTDGKLTFGIKTFNTTINFIFFGNLKVNYLGVDTSALVESLNEKITDAETYVADVKANADVVKALNDAIAEAKEVAASATVTEAKVTETVNKLSEAKAAVAENVSAYAALAEAKAAADEALETYTEEAGYSKAADLNKLFTADEKGNSYTTIVEGYLYGNDDLKAYIQTVKDYTAALAKSFTKDGTDVTYLLADPSFDNGGEGWSGKTNYTKVDTSLKNCEAYHAAYDLYQELTGLPNGVYEVSAQAFERVGEYTTENHNAYLNGTEQIDAYLYANDSQQPVCSAYSETMNDGGKTLDGQHFANSMSDFASMSAEGNFWVSVKVPVTDGKLRLGIKCDSYTNWSIWDNFYLTYVSSNVLALYVEELNDAIAEAETIGEDAAMPSLIEALNTAVTNGKALAENADATQQQLIAATEAVKTATAAAKDNAEAYEEMSYLRTAVDLFVASHPADNYTGTAGLVKYVDETGDENGNTLNKILSEKPYTTDQLTAYAEKLSDMIDEVAKTFTKEGTDVTDILTNPSFDDGAEGWVNAGDVQAAGNVEFYQKDFNMYQEITGLPNGVYDITVAGMQRKGNYSDATYNVWKDKLENTTAELYANDVYARIKSAYDEHMTEPSEYTDWRKDFAPTGTEGIYFPNCPATFDTAAKAGLYRNRVRVTITDGTLRIGVQGKQASDSQDWSIFDDFKVTYVHAQTYVLNPEVEYNWEDMECVDVKVQRYYEEGKWTPICLPFTVTEEELVDYGAGAELVALDKVEGNRFYFKTAKNIEAGVAYLIKPTTLVLEMIYFDRNVIATPNNGVNAAGFGFQGTYNPIEVATDGTAMIVDETANPSVATAETAKVLGSYAYLVVPSAEDAANVTLDINGSVTGIDAINATVVANGQKVYNVNGQYVGNSLNALPHGVYVVNGRKVVK